MSEDEDERVIPFWERKPATPQLVVDNTPPPYQAFDVQDKLLVFIVHCHTAKQGQSFSYKTLNSVQWSEAFDYLAIYTTQNLIRVWGQDLQPIANALNSHTCKTMREFHKAKYTAPPPNDVQPFIQRIVVTSIKDPANVEARTSEEV